MKVVIKPYHFLDDLLMNMNEGMENSFHKKSISSTTTIPYLNLILFQFKIANFCFLLTLTELKRFVHLTLLTEKLNVINNNANKGGFPTRIMNES